MHLEADRDTYNSFFSIYVKISNIQKKIPLNGASIFLVNCKIYPQSGDISLGLVVVHSPKNLDRTYENLFRL